MTTALDHAPRRSKPAARILIVDDEQSIREYLDLLLSRAGHSTESAGTLAAAQKLLGTKGVVDLTLTCGYYTCLSLGQIALAVEMDAGKVSTL